MTSAAEFKKKKEFVALPAFIEEAAFQEAPGRLAIRAPASGDAIAVVPPLEMQP